MIFGKWGQEKKVLKSGVGDVVSAIISLLLVLAIYGVWG